jgi:ribosomal protein S18 acetylase RimI-like enzyme
VHDDDEGAHVVRIVRLPDSLHREAVALWHEAGLTRPWNDPDADLTRALAGPASDVLAVVDDDRLLGTAMVGHDGHRGWLYYLSVASAARRRGVGTALVRACEAWLVERDVPKVQLMVRRDNAPALAFYAPLGYDLVDVTVLGRRLDG